MKTGAIIVKDSLVLYFGDTGRLSPLYGPIKFRITIKCPDETTVEVRFDAYIDPSGEVLSFLPDGTPAALPLATVVLSRSDEFSGPFDVVPDKSDLMSPSNRRNPDITVRNGHFGWDVVPGFYQVRASKANCAEPGDPRQPYVDSYVMEIPPPVTDLVLQLDCGKPTFTDVHAGDFFYNGATYLAAISVLGGYGDPARCPTGAPCFLPGNNVTRGQAAKIISNAAGLGNNVPTTQQTFEDVAPNTNPFWLYIERMAEFGYVGGYPCGGPGEPCMPGNRPYFRWNNQLTRSQLTKILVTSNQLLTTTPDEPTFKDVPTTDPFYTYVETAYAEGLMTGYKCGGPGEECGIGSKPYFRGGADATRAQLSKMVTLTLIAP
ncbi:MAG TPA: S-layer homology domain-containing protein, partial [Chloroflexia bacterium]|nr:S-layer homology domain-containing protein [Chloroflexia bacterium]